MYTYVSTNVCDNLNYYVYTKKKCRDFALGFLEKINLLILNPCCFSTMPCCVPRMCFVVRQRMLLGVAQFYTVSFTAEQREWGTAAALLWSLKRDTAQERGEEGPRTRRPTSQWSLNWSTPNQGHLFGDFCTANTLLLKKGRKGHSWFVFMKLQIILP